MPWRSTAGRRVSAEATLGVGGGGVMIALVSRNELVAVEKVPIFSFDFSNQRAPHGRLRCLQWWRRGEQRRGSLAL